MSAGNLLLQGTIVALASSGVVSSWRCLGSFSVIWGVSLCREDSTKECYGLLFYGAHLFAVEDESFFLGHIEQVDDVCIMVSVILSVDEHVIMCMANTLGHWAMISSILIWKMSCDILSPKGTRRNLYLLRWVLNVVRSNASSAEMHTEEGLVAVYLWRILVAPMRT